MSTKNMSFGTRNSARYRTTLILSYVWFYNMIGVYLRHLGPLFVTPSKRLSLVLFFRIFSSPEHKVLWGAIVMGHRQSLRLAGWPSVHLSVRLLTISLKIFSSKTRRPILIELGRNVPWMKLYKIY